MESRHPNTSGKFLVRSFTRFAVCSRDPKDSQWDYRGSKSRILIKKKLLLSSKN